MSFAPENIKAVAAYWVAHGGLNGGIVGNLKHCRGYHLGQDRIFGPCACKPDGVCKPGLGWNDYSVRAQRDKDGLTDAAAAFDLSWALADKTGLRAFSNWLAAEIAKGAPDTLDIMEMVWSPDGVAVKVYSRINAYSTADTSHRWHTHIGWGRDAIKAGRDLLAVFRRYFEPAVTPEVDVYPVTSYVPGYLATVADPTGPANIRVAPAPTAAIIRAIPKGQNEVWTVVGFVKGAYSAFGNSDEWLVRANNGVWEYTAKGNVFAGPAPAPAPPDTTPFDQADMNEYAQAAVTTDRAKAKPVIVDGLVKVTWD